MPKNTISFPQKEWPAYKKRLQVWYNTSMHEQDTTRPITTLFMLMSVDGKISTGDNDSLDFDADLPKIDGVKEGLHQYYEIEQTTDLWSCCSGRVQAKMGVNSKPFPNKSEVSFVLIDDDKLTPHGVEYFCHLAHTLVIVTNNHQHPATQVSADNLHILYHQPLDLGTTLSELKTHLGCEKLTIQTGGTLNNIFLRDKLIDYLDIVVAPVLVGGGRVSTLIDGPGITSPQQLDQLGVLQLISATTLQNSYLRLRYQVINNKHSADQ